MSTQMAKQVQICTSNSVAQMDQRVLGVAIGGRILGDERQTRHVHMPGCVHKDAGSRTSLRRATTHIDSAEMANGGARDGVAIGL
jgi:hypothetical protein